MQHSSSPVRTCSFSDFQSCLIHDYLLANALSARLDLRSAIPATFADCGLPPCSSSQPAGPQSLVRFADVWLHSDVELPT